MGTPSAGILVLVPFPFSDLSRSKLRPAVVLADAGRGDWILCQVTSQPYGDPRAVELTQADFQTGSLRVDSCARPGKMFTASASLMQASIGRLRQEAFARLCLGVAGFFEPADLPWRGKSYHKFDHILVIVRCEQLPIQTQHDADHWIGTPYAFWSEEVAETEAKRLNTLNEGKAQYSVQLARLERREASG